MNAGIIRSLKAEYRRCFVQYVVDYFENHNIAAPNLDVLQVIHMIANTWEELPVKTIFHCWQKVGLVESQDKSLHRSYEDYQYNLQLATQTAILSLIDVNCNSQQIEDLARDFLNYDGEAPNSDAQPDDISLSEIILDLQCSPDPDIDHDSDTETSDISQPPTAISLAEADTHLHDLVILLEKSSFSEVPTAGKSISVPDAVCFLTKLRSGLKSHMESRKKQVNLSTWFTTASERTSSPSLLELESSFSSPTPAPPTQILDFAPIRPIRLEDAFESLNSPSTTISSQPSERLSTYSGQGNHLEEQNQWI